jgi:hypothetical protein
MRRGIDSPAVVTTAARSEENKLEVQKEKSLNDY